MDRMADELACNVIQRHRVRETLVVESGHALRYLINHQYQPRDSAKTIGVHDLDCLK